VTGSDPRALTGRRVVVVNWRDPWHRLAGGSERYAWELAGALRDAGAGVELWTARDEGQSSGEDRDGIGVRRWGGAYAFYGGVWARLLTRRVRRRAPHLVIDMDCGIPSFTPLPAGRRTAVVLFVHHVHQEQFRTAMRRPMADLGRFLERRMMPLVYRRVPTVAVSASTVAELRDQLGWRGAVDVIHNGTELPETEPLPASGAERIVVLGRVVAHKRLDLVVRAFALVRERRPGASLDLVGTGPELPAVVAVVEELGLGEAVRVHGFLPEQEKSQVLSAARLHVCASDAEGWGQVVLEAAAHGLPTVARDVPGLRDSVVDGTTGWLLGETHPPGSAGLVDALAEGMEKALDELVDPGVRARVAHDCRTRAEGFAWERMHEQVVEQAVEVLDRTR
jgi:glycosyltransferase involved in cell wall biosynthesis